MKSTAALLLLFALQAFAGDKLPESDKQWNGTDSEGDHRTEVKSGSNVITLTRIKYTPDGDVEWTEITAGAWNDSTKKYHTALGGTIEFDDVVDNNTTAYRYTYKDSSGAVLETGLVSTKLK